MCGGPGYITYVAAIAFPILAVILELFQKSNTVIRVISLISLLYLAAILLGPFLNLH